MFGVTTSVQEATAIGMLLIRYIFLLALFCFVAKLKYFRCLNIDKLQSKAFLPGSSDGSFAGELWKITQRITPYVKIGRMETLKSDRLHAFDEIKSHFFESWG
jgi:hypothetical protein